MPHRGQKVALLAGLAALALGQRGCLEPEPAKVQVQGVPPGIVSLTVMAIAKDPYATMRTTGRQAPPAGQIELDLPEGLEGPMALGAVAFDDRHCAVALGSQAEAYARRPPPALVRSARASGVPGCSKAPPRRSSIRLEPLAKPDCRAHLPMVVEVRPPQAAPEARVVLRGFPFRPDMVTKVNGRPVEEQRWLSPSEVQVKLPADLPPGKAVLKVVNSDTTEDTRDDLLTIGG